MANNEKVPNILIHLEIDIKVTKTYHHTLSEWLEWKGLTMPSAGEDVKEAKQLVQMKMGISTLKNGLRPYTKAEHKCNLWPRIFTPRDNLRETHILVHSKTYARMFTAALLMSLNWTVPKWSTGRAKLWSSATGEYYDDNEKEWIAVIGNSRGAPHKNTVGQEKPKAKEIHYLIPFIYSSKIRKIINLWFRKSRWGYTEERDGVVIGWRQSGVFGNNSYVLLLDLSGEHMSEKSTRCKNKISALSYLCLVL